MNTSSFAALPVLVDPVDRYPLVFVTEGFQCVRHGPECDVKVLVDDDHVQVFVILALQQGTFLDGRNKIVILGG